MNILAETDNPPTTNGNNSMWGWLNDRLKWCPTSMDILSEAEKKILSYVKIPFTLKYVEIPCIESSESSSKIRTLSIADKTHQNHTPLVLLHGLGAAVGLWVLNLDVLAKQGPLYALDMLGFGMSSRPTFSSDPLEVERQYVDSIEQWRQQMKLEKFVLLGHSMGGYLATAYAMKHPNRVSHLILADPWGFPERKNVARHVEVPWWVKTAASVMRYFNPFTSLRVAGPWGPNLVERFRPDLLVKYSAIVDEPDVVSSYIYHCNAQTPSGETAFKTLSKSLGWAKHPMVPRIDNLSDSVPITFIYGEHSWVDSNSGYHVKEKKNNCSIDIQIIPCAGHHVYGDQPEPFNSIVLEICDKINSQSNDAKNEVANTNENLS